MKQRIESMIRALEQHQALILVSILASSGSTHRGAGAMMLVFEDRHIEGTIGGVQWNMRRSSMQKSFWNRRRLTWWGTV